MAEFIGAKISLISRSDIRYVGILHEINSEESTVALEQGIFASPPESSQVCLANLIIVRSFGTEGRRGGDEVPPSDNVFEYIVFRGSDVKDLKVEEAGKKPEAPPPHPLPDDPAILAVYTQDVLVDSPPPFLFA
jgi:protein LSM14